MAISLFASFRTYIVSSLLLATGVVTHAVYTKRFFYRSVVHLANSKLAVLAVANMGLCSVLCVWRLIQSIFLGQLRFRERERLHLRARDAIIESCFAISVFREDFNPMFVGLVMTLLLVKSLHWLAKDRIEFLEEQPLSPRSVHVRLVSLMALLFTIDAVFVARSVANTYAESGRTMYALFAFESAVLMVDLLSDFVHYVFLVIDLSMDGRWEGKWLYSFYSELISDMCQLTVYILFFIYVQIHYSFPYHIIRELYMTFYKFQRRCSDFLRYRRVVATMNDLFADATEEQLAQGDRTCIICREEMTSAKVLACGHMFHPRCLQSWLKRQLSCPTCRATIDVNTPVRNQANANGNANPNANANANANENANANANANAAGANNQPDNNNNNNQNNANNNNINNVLNRAPAQPGAAAPPGEAGARLLDAVNDWWQALLNDAGAPPPNGANVRAPRAPLPARPAQAAAGGGAGFLFGPNAAAHMQFRMRRRAAAWPPIPAGDAAAAARAAPPAAAPAAAAPTVPPQLAALSHAAQQHQAAPIPPPPHAAAAAQRLPLDRLLAVQEQIEVLRAEVQELVEMATAEPDEVDAGAGGAASGDASGEGTVGAGAAASDVASASTAADSAATAAPQSAGDKPSVARDAAAAEQPAAAAPATEVVDEQDEEDDEAARIRQRRIQFLERGRAT